MPNIELTKHEASTIRSGLIHALRLCEEERIDWDRVHPGYRTLVGEVTEWEAAPRILELGKSDAIRNAIAAYVSELGRQERNSFRECMEAFRLEYITTISYARERTEG